MHALGLILFQSQADIERATRMLPAFFAGMMVIGVVAMAIIVIPFWFICKKAGMSPWLSLLWFIPMGGLVLCYVLAFADWKVVPAPQMAYAQPVPPFPPQR